MELIMGRQGIGPLMSELTYSFQTPKPYAVTLMTILLTAAINGSYLAPFQADEYVEN